MRQLQHAAYEHPLTMEITAAGDEIDPAELNQPGWAVIRHRQAFHDAANVPPRTRTYPGPASPQRGTGNCPPRRQLPASPLRATDIKIVPRPHGQLDLRSVAEASLADAFMRQMGIPINPVDQACIQQPTNYLLISTPSEEHVKNYASVNSLTIRRQRYEVAAHVLAPSNTVARVIFNIPEENTPEQVRDSIYATSTWTFASQRLSALTHPIQHKFYLVAPRSLSGSAIDYRSTTY